MVIGRRRFLAWRRPAVLLGALAAAALPSGPSAAGAATRYEAAAKEAATLVLARVDGEPITLAELQEGFGARHMGHGSLLSGEPILRDVLDKAIAERLMIQEGYRMGIPEEPEFRRTVEAYRDMTLLKVMEQREFHEAAAPSQAEIEEVYAALKVQRRVFLIETPSRERAEEALSRLKDGEEFGEVARSISTHRSRLRGGDLGWITWGRLDPAVEEAVFAAKAGDRVGPIPTGGLLTIALVTEVKEGEPPELEKVEGRIREILRQRKRSRIFQDFVAAIREKHPPVENEEALAALLSGAAPEGGGSADPPDETVLMKTAMGLELTAGRIRQKAAGSNLSLAEAWSKGAVDTMLIDEARRRVEIDEALERKIGLFVDGRVRDEVQKLALERMPEIGEKELKAYYESKRDDLKGAGSWHLRHILVGTEEEAAEIRRLLAEGADFAELARKRSLDAASAPSGGDLGWLEGPAGSGAGAGGSEILSLRPGEISGIIKMAAGFAVVQVLEIREGKTPTYEESKLRAARALIKDKSREILDGFVGRLREHAAISVDESAIRRGAALLDVLVAGRLSPGEEEGGQEGEP